MATRIRLRRVGRRKAPEYRIVVTDRREARDGRFIETLGFYRPRENPATISVDAEKARGWIAKGATPSDTVRSLLKQAGVFDKAESPVPADVVSEAPPAEPVVAPDPGPAPEEG
ncbi:MAG TPA: 30S ribosomal protein S16 [Gemmatimonadales bacterium]